jgi:hypothetical protein
LRRFQAFSRPSAQVPRALLDADIGEADVAKLLSNPVGRGIRATADRNGDTATWAQRSRQFL